MEAAKRQKIIKSAGGVLVVVLLFFSPGLRLPVLDSTADVYFREAMTKAGVAYATCRIINASVSIVKESSLNLQPAGLGVTLAVGQVLDPIDDMTERVTDVLVTAIMSLGVQKLVYELSVSLAPPILAVFLLIISMLIWFDNERLATVQKITMRFMLLILIARFALPIAAAANGYIQEHFFEDKISNAYKELSVGAEELDKLTDFSLPEIDGLVGTIKNNAAFLQRKSMEFKNAIVTTVSNAGNIIENLMKLAFLYVGVFLIQVIALPIIVFWMLIKLANSLFETNVPVTVRHSRVSRNGNVRQVNPVDG